jgi:hypothetical protein
MIEEVKKNDAYLQSYLLQINETKLNFKILPNVTFSFYFYMCIDNRTPLFRLWKVRKEGLVKSKEEP